MTDFAVGDDVTKCTGDYEWDGVVRAVFAIYDGGPVRIVVAHPIHPDQGKGHVLHIYAPGNLRKL